MKVQTTDDRLLIEVELAVPREQAWAALTSPAAIAIWWGEHVRLSAHAGGKLREDWTDAAGRNVATTGVVTRCEPPTLLEMTWSDDDWPGETRVLFVLDEHDDDRSSLRLEHRGWEALPAERRRSLIDAHALGWRRHMRSLCAYLER